MQFFCKRRPERYPKTLEEDKTRLTSQWLHYLFAPDALRCTQDGNVSQLKLKVHWPIRYPCGRIRPGHLLVSYRSDQIVYHCSADCAISANKDFQQLKSFEGTWFSRT